MAHLIKTGLWVADDGSWGNGEVVIVDVSTWTDTQHYWLEQLDEEDAVSTDALISIDNNVKPEELEEE